MSISRDAIADILEEIATLLELKGENPFKIKAYKNGADVVRDYDGDIIHLAANNELKGIKGIGSALQDKLHELATTGELEFYQNLRGEFPATIFELFEIQGLGPKKIKALYQKLDITSIASLKEACETDRIKELSGFGPKSVSNILKAIETKEKFAGRYRLGDITALAETILAAIKEHPSTSRAAIAGSYRRAKETLHDLDFLVATKQQADIIDYFTQLDEVEEIIAKGETKAAVRLVNGLQCDLRAVSNEQFPFALQYFSGSKEHNVSIRQLANKRGWSLNEYAFTHKDTSQPAPPNVVDERDIYRALELEFIEPELRENRGEIEAADAGELPRLVELENLRGTFHNHTTASDGRNSLEEMAQAAQDLGLQYLGIADHSKSSFQANGLYADRLLKQIEEIRQLNEQWDDFKIIAGSEVDILKDGSLDFDDDTLSQLDYCVASVHNSFTLAEKDMTARIIRAMENEHVTMIGHLTGRLLLRRDPYAVNVDKIIDCAARTGTIIELNCSPRRLDMDWRWWHKARDLGVMTSINPDAHGVEQLQNLHFGVRLARKGWLRREDVLNCMNLDEVLSFLSKSKSERIR
ncbi:DNA polymerase/3'-5' exonuclease PolX [Persicirhabdus sediminis]|uniref:DNA polymerase beta n=1 Tax=Persicirhabdus sediminis TaxID=454144 RepID=A0A8J7MGC2_9BACT|nr:DNA polymerase/3'-5' exonuclease PolX [Persicirhabdus sediminis]MBK1791299.1 DNA polymerase/3'-5' exonuclease PolX [Persicirhabdus sediminis]